MVVTGAKMCKSASLCGLSWFYQLICWHRSSECTKDAYSRETKRRVDSTLRRLPSAEERETGGTEFSRKERDFQASPTSDWKKEMLEIAVSGVRLVYLFKDALLCLVYL